MTSNPLLATLCIQINIESFENLLYTSHLKQSCFQDLSTKLWRPLLIYKAFPTTGKADEIVTIMVEPGEKPRACQELPWNLKVSLKGHLQVFRLLCSTVKGSGLTGKVHQFQP